MNGPRQFLPVIAWLLASGSAAVVRPAPAADHPGIVVYREHCERCHGEHGGGTRDFPDPLAGDFSVNQLAAYIDDTMPEDDPTAVTGAAARQVAEYIHGAFYSPVARDRNRPARVELARLTVRQHRNAVADLIGGFRGRLPPIDGRHGLRGKYFRGRRFDAEQSLVFDRIDPRVDFDFGVEGPDPERFEPNRFAIRWTGSIVPPETGVYEFVVRTEHSIRLFVNTSAQDPPLIDAYIKSEAENEHRGSILLLGGRPCPITLEFFKARHGVEDLIHDPLARASIALLWKPPHGAVQPVPERCLIPHDSPPVFVLRTPFPPDDRSIGYERGTTVSQEWFAAATAAGSEAAAEVMDHIEQLAKVAGAADRGDAFRRFAASFAARAFRGPLSDDLRTLVVDRAFADTPDPDTALKRSLLLVLASPRFLFREAGAVDTSPSSFETAARLSFGLWDSIPDETLREAADRNELTSPEQVRSQARRMVEDWRTRAKIADFLLAWLRIDHGPEIVKDKVHHPDFSPEIAADLRTSLLLSLEDAVWNGGDYRSLFTDDETYLNGRLAPFYGVKLPPDDDFRRVRLDEGRRGGVLSHPYMMSVLSYAGGSSPIHRGVFLARSVLGNVLRPPQEAIAPLAADQHPDLTTRERVTLQTEAVACQTCHTMINPLGFALEEFDAVGRHRTAEKRGDGDRTIDASGSYLPREGEEAAFRGARELAAYVATSGDAKEAFVQSLFHAVVKQPVRAWGPDTLATLCRSFEAGGFDIRRLMVDIVVVASLPPQPSATGTAPREKSP